MRELSPVEAFRKRGWKKGTVIRSTEMEMGNPHHEYWKITGFGKYEVLGIRVNLPPYTTCSEGIIPYSGNTATWRKVKKLCL